MLVGKKIKCPECGDIFTPKTWKHEFCHRKCFMKAYHKRAKESKFPSYVCEKCGHLQALDFHPKLSSKRWDNIVCNKCGVKREDVND